MKVAILGSSRINDILEKRLVEEGFIPFRHEALDDIMTLKGEKFDFTLRSSKNEIKADYLIMTEDLLSDEAFHIHESRLDRNAPVVFILDKSVESPSYFTVGALKSAIKYAGQKRKVFFLSKFLRTAGQTTESLYKEARNAGVVFIKYKYIAISYDKNTRIYQLAASDEYGVTNLETPSVIMPDDFITGKVNVKADLKALRLKLDNAGLIDNEKEFLFPANTNRKGIYSISTASCTSMEDALDRISYVVAEIKKETAAVRGNFSSDMENDRFVEIDSGKCAFCYTCYRACPHAAMAPDYENSVMKSLKNSCSACGICVTACPANAIVLSGNGPGNELSKVLKILCCENSGEIAAKKLRAVDKELFDVIDLEPVSCGGEVSAETITASLKQYRKILVLTCMEGACKHFEGNKRLEKLVGQVKNNLKESGLDDKKVEYMKLSLAMPYALRDQIHEMLESGGIL